MCVCIPDDVYYILDVCCFIQQVYPGLQSSYQSPGYFKDYRILTSQNETVYKLNDHLLDQLPGDMKTYLVDDIYNINNQWNHNVIKEDIVKLNSGSLPPVELQLKIGVPLMLIHNITITLRLCNRTCIILLQMLLNCLEVHINDNHFNRNVHLLYYVKNSSRLDNFIYYIYQHQFPVHLAFIMTINKIQGQSLEYISVNLRKPVFSHDQLYIIILCATDVNHVSVLLELDNQD